MWRGSFVVLLAIFACGCRDSGPPAVSICEIAGNPAAYNHELIETTALISHDFEDFTLFDPRCRSSEVSIWAEYGGRANSGTIYCCNESAARTRDKPLVIENVPTTLLEDENFKVLDGLVQRKGPVLLRATLRGRYFSGEKQKFPGGTRWAGYGHFGFHSLFVIEQVISVKELPRRPSNAGEAQ
jgi:hypothetical protein